MKALIIFSLLVIPGIAFGQSWAIERLEGCWALELHGGSCAKKQTPSQKRYSGKSVEHNEALGNRDRLFEAMDDDYVAREELGEKQAEKMLQMQRDLEAARNRAQQLQNVQNQGRFGSDGTFYAPTGGGGLVNTRTGEVIH